MIEKAVLISIKPKWCNLIASGLKTVEVRKTMPKLNAGFRCYIYCTKNGITQKIGLLQKSDFGKIVGEFVCDTIYETSCAAYEFYDDVCISQSLLSPKEIMDYARGGKLYFWHISDLKLYDQPKMLSDFGLKKAPQSWCYVDEKMVL